MPLWAVIIFVGAGFCGFVFLKAREADAKNTLKKVKEGHKDVRKAAKHVAKQPSTVAPYVPPTSQEEVQISGDLSSAVARDLEEIMKRKEL